MIILHLSDLHIGKVLSGFPLEEDQKHIFKQIIKEIKKEQPDAVLVSGDIYDKTAPSSAAVSLADWFLTEVLKYCPHLFVLSGNHDSPERLAFGREMMERVGMHISKVYDGTIDAVTLTDAQGNHCKVHMLPFIKPVHARAFIADQADQIVDYTTAIAAALRKANLASDMPNLLMTHQFVSGAVRSESETISVGGSDNVDVAVFDGFDYVALGHLHSAQSVGKPHVRYCGTPLKYSASEANNDKSITKLTIAPDKSVQIDTIPLTPLRDLQVKKDTFDALLAQGQALRNPCEDYLYIVLTDEEPADHALSRLRRFYPNILQLTYDNKRTQSCPTLTPLREEETAQPLELFSLLYAEQNGQPLSDIQHEHLTTLIERIWEGSIA